MLQAKRELARKLATIGADHAAEMSAVMRRAATDRKAAEHKAVAAEEALSVMEAAHHDAVQKIATLQATHEIEMSTRMEAAEAAQQEVLALQEQNVELTVRALRESRSASVIHTLSCALACKQASNQYVRLIWVLVGLIGCTFRRGEACSSDRRRTGAASCSSARGNAGARQ